MPETKLFSVPLSDAFDVGHMREQGYFFKSYSKYFYARMHQTLTAFSKVRRRVDRTVHVTVMSVQGNILHGVRDAFLEKPSHRPNAEN